MESKNGNSRMSRLPNAPLVEVIYELRWKVTNQKDLSKYQYLHGDLYSQLKREYPFRQLLTPPDIPAQVLTGNPVHRFRRKENEYPLYQVGPGLLTLNTVDSKYDWSEFFRWAQQLIETFIATYKPETGEKFTPKLLYIDFLAINTDKENILTFLSENLNINISHKFPVTKGFPKTINFSISYPCDLGTFLFNISTGTSQRTQQGLVMQTSVTGPDIELDSTSMLNWLNDAHTFCSSTFKEITKGDLYNSFKKQP